jgi:hypothetical protein
MHKMKKQGNEVFNQIEKEELRELSQKKLTGVTEAGASVLPSNTLNSDQEDNEATELPRIDTAQVEELVQNEIFKVSSQLMVLEKNFDNRLYELDKGLHDVERHMEFLQLRTSAESVQSENEAKFD